MSNIIPVTFRIVVKPSDVEQEDPVYAAAKAAGLALLNLEREQEAVDKGTVVSFGPTAFVEYGTDNPLSVGDTIVYARHSGKSIKDPVTNETFVIINDADVVAILQKGA